MVNGCLREVSKVLKGSVKGTSMIFKEVLRVFQGKFRGVPRDLQGGFKRASKQFQ